MVITMKLSMEEQYSKSIELWSQLHTAQQLVINDEAYPPIVLQMLEKCLDIVEQVQTQMEIQL